MSASPGLRRVGLVVGTTAGGTGTHVAMLAEGCVAQGAAVSVFGPAATGRRLGFAQLPGVEFTAVEFGDRPRPGDAIAVLRLRRALRTATRPDVVHAHGLRAGALAALARGRVRGGRRPRLVVTVHNAPPAGGGVPALIYRMLEHAVARRADLVLCVSSDLAARMRAAGARRVSRAVVAAPRAAPPPAAGPATPPPAAKQAAPSPAAGPAAPLPAAGPAAPPSAAKQAAPPPAAIQAGSPRAAKQAAPPPAEIDAAPPVAAMRATTPSAGAATPPPADLADKKERPVVLAVGRLAAQKGFDTLLAAATAWRDLDPEPNLVIAGDGPLAGSLSAQADELGVEPRFLGHRDDVAALLEEAAVFVLPSLWEGQPLVLQEALRAGVPIVATKTGGIPDLTGDDAALLVPPGDEQRLAAAVRSVLTDPALATRLRAAARRRGKTLPTRDDAVAAALAAYADVLR